MKNILFIVGSMRKASFNLQLAQEVEQFLGDDVKVTYLDYRDVPVINQDEEFPTPEAVAHVRQSVREADGLWIFTPEYNDSYPGLLKNLIDWLSRPARPGAYADGTAIMGKKVAISWAGGRNATAGAREKLHALLAFVKAAPLDHHVGMIVNPEAWSTNKLILSEENRKAFSEQAELFMEDLEK